MRLIADTPLFLFLSAVLRDNELDVEKRAVWQRRHVRGGMGEAVAAVESSRSNRKGLRITRASYRVVWMGIITKCRVMEACN